MSWDVVRLGEVISHRKGFITIDDEKPYKLCRVQLHRRGVLLREIIKGYQIKTKKQQICKGGDFLVAEMDAKVGGYGFIPAELDGAIVSSHYYLFELNTAKINPKYLEVLSKLPIIQDQIKATGSTNYAAIRPQNVLDWEIPLPDIQTQEKIADIYLKTSTGCDYLKSNYLLQLDLLKKLHQQILQDAVQGKLVPQDPSDEPAQKLLERIKTEKEKLVREKKIKKEKPLPEIEPQETPFEIPENWVWCRLGEITTKIGSGSTPSGSNYASKGYPFFRSQNVLNQGLIYDDIKFIDNKVQNQMSGTTVNPSDLLLNITGGSLGRCALVPDDFKKGNVSQHVCIIRPLTLNNKFYHKVVLSPYFQKLIFDSTTGAGREGLPKYNLEKFTVPIPPLKEQHRIVTKIELLMTLCDELMETIQQNQNFNQELLQVSLKEALEVKHN